MSSLKEWARTVPHGRPARELIVEMEYLLLGDHPTERSAVSRVAATTASQLAARQGASAGVPVYPMWRADRSRTAFDPYFAFGMLHVLLSLAAFALPIGLALEPLWPFADVVMASALCALLALPFGWLSEVFRVKAALINVSSTAVFVSCAVLNAVGLAFILAYSPTLPPTAGVSSWPVWPLAIAAAALGNAALARWGFTTQRALLEDAALHRAEQDRIGDARRHPIDRIIRSALTRCRAALSGLSPEDCNKLIATRSAALDVLVSRNVLSPDLADALRPAFPGTALIAFLDVRVDLGIE